MYYYRQSISKCLYIFKQLAKRVFTRQEVSKIPILSYIEALAALVFTNSLYLVENIKAPLKQIFSIEKGILDYLYTTTIEIKTGFPIATVYNYPLYYPFTNYNRVGEYNKD